MNTCLTERDAYWILLSKLKRRKEYMNIMWMVIESGAVLTISSLAMLVLWLLHFNVGQLVSEMAAQLGVSRSVCQMSYNA